MPDYRRLISYIYEYEGKEKGKNVGFVKLESRGGQCRLNLNVKRIYVGGNAIGVYLLDRNRKETFLGNIFVRGGSGEFRTTVDARNIEGSGNALDTYCGLTVHDVKNSWRSYTTIWEDTILPEPAAVPPERNTKRGNAALLGDAVVIPTAQEVLPGRAEHLRPAVSSVVKEIEAELAREERRGREEYTVITHAAEIGFDQETGENRGDEAREQTGEARDLPAGAGSADESETVPSESGDFPGRTRQAEGRQTLPAKAELTGRTQTIPAESRSGGELPPPAAGAGSVGELPTSSAGVGSSGELPPPAAGAERGGEQPASSAGAGSVGEQPMSPAGADPVKELQTVASKAGADKESQTDLAGYGSAKETQASSPQPEAAVEPEAAAQEPTAMQPPRFPSPELENPDLLKYLQETEEILTDPEKLWEELRKNYPKIQPFDYEGECEILTIRPQDIGRLPRESWIYGNNSFLLHGYYNFRYLILVRLSAKDGQTGTPRYLIGVPGHYYSNEKYMASMFGFPNFVLSKNQPPNDGRFGYWYTDIRLHA
ncbi:MAG: hypothetical protein HFE84_04590 [Lachnospiraceae bacterium]|nr:hypothetical protein [Lachnospiraceae bacterium]